MKREMEVKRGIDADVFPAQEQLSCSLESIQNPPSKEIVGRRTCSLIGAAQPLTIPHHLSAMTSSGGLRQ